MTSVSPRGKVLLLLLAVLLALPWSLAAEPRRAAPPHVAAQNLAPAVSLAAWIGSWLRSLRGAAGTNIDPNGVAASPPAPRPNTDPNGLATADAGTNIDPDG